MRRPLRLAALALLTASCGPTDGASGSAGGTIVVGAGADADALLPPLYQSLQGRTVGELMFDRLADIGPELNVTGDAGFLPRLAESWRWSPDSLTITFALDPRARWHDGAPVRAGDVAFAFRVIRDSANASPVVANLRNIDSVVVLDSLTAAMHFARRGVEQFYHATLIIPLPEHRLGAITAGAALRTHAEALQPVGSGRFRFVSWTPKDRLELAAVEDHYRGRPQLDRVLFVISAPAAGYARVWAGETDLWEPLPPNIVPEATPHPHVRVITGPGYEYGFLAFNLRDQRDPKRAHPLFGDRGLRRALTMAIDRGAVRRATFDSLASDGVGPFVRAQQTADTTVAQIPFDSAAAAQALDALGWSARGSDGVRRRGAQRLAFAVHVPTSSPTRIQAATVIQEQLRRAGVEMTLRALDFQTMLAERDAGRFDAIMWTWRSTPSPSGLRGTWASAAVSGSRQNISTYENPEFDRAVVDGLGATDLASRKAHLRRAYQLIIDDAPAVWLYEARNIAAAHRRLQIPAWRSDAWWLTLGDWTIDPSQRLPRDERPATPEGEPVPRAILGRLAQAALVVLLVVTATFALIRLSPRDPFAAVAESPEAPPDVRDRLRGQFGFASPLHVQYGLFVVNAVRGDLGWSLSRSAPVRQVLATALPNTLILMGSALLLGFLGGIALGAWEGWRPRSALARAADRAGLVVLAVPEFVLALLLVLGPALALDLFPVGGIRDDFSPAGLRGLMDRLHHLALPTLALATILAAVVARHQRAAMTAVREREFVRAARAKGLGEWRIFLHHALRNALVPVLTLAGVLIPAVFGGAVLVETVFGWPGMGRLTVDAVISADYHLVVGCVLVSSLAVVTGSLLADLAVLWADPRLRRDR